MKTIVFASNNAHKLEEVCGIFKGKFEIKSLKEIGCFDDIPETGTTFRENALQKAQYVKEHFGYDCFADDSGLQVMSLGGEPGVFSARYAKMNGVENEPTKDEANMRVLLGRLFPSDGTSLDTKACFRTCIALVYDGEVHYFDGIVEGHIISEKRGEGGFGYDPIFVPEGYDKTFAELGTSVKNTISHRARAVAKLADFLNEKAKSEK